MLRGAAAAVRAAVDVAATSMARGGTSARAQATAAAAKALRPSAAAALPQVGGMVAAPKLHARASSAPVREERLPSPPDRLTASSLLASASPLHRLRAGAGAQGLLPTASCRGGMGGGPRKLSATSFMGSWASRGFGVQGVGTAFFSTSTVAGHPFVPAARAQLPTAVAAGQSLLRAMLAAKPQAIAGSKSGARLIRLAGDAAWLQLGGVPLFVRHFYEQCAAGAMNNVKPGGRFIIRGNGGIGKSSFGLYLLWLAVNAGRTAVYVSHMEYYGYIFHADGRVEAFVRTHLLQSAAEVLQDPNTLLIFDGDGNSQGQGRPPICKATTVLVTSPKLERYSEFEKTDVAHLVFPVFSRDEIDDMLESCYPHLNTPEGCKGVDERYERWGGIPRYVLALLRPSAQAKLDNALTAIDCDRLADVLRKADIEDDSAVWHRLFHLKPRGETAEGFEGGDTESAYALDRIELGSQIIAEKVYTAMQQSRSDKLLALLAQPTKGTQLAKF